MQVVQDIFQYGSKIQQEDQERILKEYSNSSTSSDPTLTLGTTDANTMTENTPTTTEDGTDVPIASGKETQPQAQEDENPIVVAGNTPEPSAEENDDGDATEDEGSVEAGKETTAATDDDGNVKTKKTKEELEAKAIAEATASANANYTPPTSTLNSPSPYPLIRSVDGMSLKKYNATPSIFTARDVPVPLRGKFTVPIHVTLGGSIVEYTVASKDYDIGFGIVAEREEGVTVVAPLDRVDAEVKPVNGKFLVGSVPCALIFTFDNEYSWFREKRITYKITVRPPTKENIIAGRKYRAESALKVISTDLTGAEDRLGSVSTKHEELISDVERLEKELEEKKKSLGVVAQEVDGLKKRVQLRSVQEDLLNRRLADGWEDEYELDEEEESEADRAEI